MSFVKLVYTACCLQGAARLPSHTCTLACAVCAAQAAMRRHSRCSWRCSLGSVPSLPAGPAGPLRAPCGHRPLITNKSKLMVASASSAQRQALPDVLDNPSVVGQIKACPLWPVHCPCLLDLVGGLTSEIHSLCRTAWTWPSQPACWAHCSACNP